MGPGIIAAAITTIGTFLLLLASDYRGLGELGAVCGLGLAVALVQVLLVVPAALTLAGPEHAPAPSWWRGIARWQINHPRQALILLLTSVCACLGYLSSKDSWLSYDSNPRNLRPAEDEVFVKQIGLMVELGLIKSGHQVLIRAQDPVSALKAATLIGERADDAAPWAGLLDPPADRKPRHPATGRLAGPAPAIADLPPETTKAHQPFLDQLQRLADRVENRQLVTPDQLWQS